MTEKDALVDLERDTDALGRLMAECFSPQNMAEVEKIEKELIAGIDALNEEIQKALTCGAWEVAAGLREKKAYLSGPQLNKLNEAKGKLQLQKDEIEGLRKKAAKLVKKVATRDKMTAEARAIIEREEGIQFSWLADRQTAHQRHPHWSNNFKPANLGLVQTKAHMSNSEKDLLEALTLENQAARLESKLVEPVSHNPVRGRTMPQAS
jgi:hypothetical protein